MVVRDGGVVVVEGRGGVERIFAEMVFRQRKRIGALERGVYAHHVGGVLARICS